MAETLQNFFTQAWVIGLLGGLAVAFFIWTRGLVQLRTLKIKASAEALKLQSEIENLRRHILTQTEINSKGNESLQGEIDQLKAQLANLGETVAAYKQKPGRAELRTLHLYEKAVRIMHARAPGFGSAWESALQDAEMEIKKEESGLLGWIRKPFQLRKAEPVHLTDSDTKD
ncbi:hypothetical protein [Coraliomargarita parva]|uniref:hypothetical protein n=1 Tax=Coraliomargarita parva TaxID=3014050 RepID=UPI0022B5D10B|nr:hypothetical protein [Coraliomargarita parva]